MKVVIHIGAARTGTTTFQNTIMQNEERLAQMGYYYPRAGFLHPTKGNAQHGLAFCLMDKYPAFVPENDRPDADQVWGDLRQELATLPEGKTVLISSETFSIMNDSAVRFIREFFADDQLTIVYVHRDHDERWQSMWEHQIRKAPYHTDRNPPERDESFAWLSPEWTEGPGYVQVEYGESALDDLLSAVGIDPATIEKPARFNKRLPEDVFDLLLALNRIEMPRNLHAQVNETVVRWHNRKKV